jgi:hypothetical protein
MVAIRAAQGPRETARSCAGDADRRRAGEKSQARPLHEGARMSITRKLVVGSLAVAAAAVGIAKISRASVAKKVAPAISAAKKATRKPRRKAKAAAHGKRA